MTISTWPFSKTHILSIFIDLALAQNFLWNENFCKFHKKKKKLKIRTTFFKLSCDLIDPKKEEELNLNFSQ